MDETNPITQIDFMQAHIEALKEQLAEKDAMIDWLASQLQARCDRETICFFCSKFIKTKCHNNNWRKAAQEAVNKNDKI